MIFFSLLLEIFRQKNTLWCCKGEPGIFASGPEDERSKGGDALEKDRRDETKVNIHLFHQWQNHCWALQQFRDWSCRWQFSWLTQFNFIKTIHTVDLDEPTVTYISDFINLFFVVRIEHSNSRSISKLKLNFVLWHFQKPVIQLFVC